jgi:hypothetical protein
MDEPVDYFSERVAATYDGTTGVFEPGAVDATVGLLAELGRGGRRGDRRDDRRLRDDPGGRDVFARVPGV